MSQASRLFRFGQFGLALPQRLLTHDGKPVRLGGRAMEILVALLEQAGELVPRDALFARVWPDTVVDESALRVHLSALRKALQEGGLDGAIVNESGRGYRFVAPLLGAEKPAPVAAPAAQPAAHHLPTGLGRIVGREETVEALGEQLPSRRFLSIVGPGGIGKTTVAIAIARHVRVGGAVSFIDFAPIGDQALVPSAVAAALGVPVTGTDPVPDIAAFLGGAPALLLLDNCEHILDAAASLAERLLGACPNLMLLVTSREPLRAEGEWVHRLPALQVPAPGQVLTPEEALGFSALRLFADRASAVRGDFAITEGNVQALADICRRLDGIPLAIEFAAVRVDILDLPTLAARLDDRFRLLTKGRRTALMRHQTLRATLDWSYDLLDETAKLVLRRIALFRAGFDMESVLPVAAFGAVDEVAAFDAMTDLVAKSMVVSDMSSGRAQFRLLDTTRYYGLEKLAETPDAREARRRHAIFCRDLIADPAAAWEGKAPREWIGVHSRRIDDIRAAIAWAFGPEGDLALGMELVMASAYLWFHLSLPNEFLGMAEAAIRAAEGTPLANSPAQAEVLAAYGHALWHARGPVPAMAEAFATAVRVAREQGDLPLELRASWGIWAQRILEGLYEQSLADAEAFQAMIGSVEALSNEQTGRHMLALSYHFMGDHVRGRALIDEVIARDQDPQRANHANHAQVDGRVAAHSLLMRLQWFGGEREAALRLARENAAETLALDHDLTLCYGLAIGSIPVLLWAGEREEAALLAARLRYRTRLLGLRHWEIWAEGVEDWLAGRDRAPADASLMQLEFFASLGSEAGATRLIEAGRLEARSWMQAELRRRLGV
ncbi:winged helix-turn-helix domain-containing protein [Acetobacteraceae bacterium H6797]|nr:winged helix-turn-helix domain-containing protein [Acetobacteraceae bacterium H6797]